ncbi:translation initiation factor IF-2 [Rhodomicrobium vannielii ATCC 17100]|uniref:Translation initiation factor IF-2 n=1 Tax=Rhodomicrobium vannielii (strain ATCC 17100 / DSM 162 / LMG 4299 / NCIMB 10020 / ATH 3.1.1) TaxID=648757 RepID=E3I1M0_RHOVT|nr:translation initiation factor IF-2 [Rhodomicrobium vannielii]ADP72395.1 translation initiation factor IF-2 [Rhodomicrobium vannielii ATCC 17100]
MSETKETDSKPAAGRKTMSLNVKRTVEQGHIRQNFSHGRSKSVLVETKRKRPGTGPGVADEPQQAQKPAPQKPEHRAFQKPGPEQGGDKRPQKVLRQLSAGEVDARARALVESRKREEILKREREVEDARRREEEALRAVEDKKRAAEEEAVAKKLEEENAQLRAKEAAEPKPEAPKEPARQEAAPAAPAPRPTSRSAEPPRRVGPDTVRVIARPQDDRRPPRAPAPDARTADARPTDARGPARDGTRPAGARPDGARPQGGAGARAGAPGARPGFNGPRGAAATPASSIPEVAARPDRTRDVDVGARARGADTEEDDRRVKRGLPGKVATPAPVKKTVTERTGRQRLTLSNALDDQQRERSLASLKRQRERQKLQASGARQERVKIQRTVILPEAITIQELANRMAERAVDIIKFLMKQGQMLKINDVIDADTAELVAEEFGHSVKRVSEEDVEEGFIGETDDPDTLQFRAPVVTIMGHVDHGKTSLLDAIRHANVVSGEAGGITQHIGAYQVTTPSGAPVTFIDTPGHAAFTAMRARGAKVTDIVVLVVAADDGVMPQTIEAINHAKAAGVPIIVAINKIDKPDADPLRVRTDLLSHDIVVESMGGDVLEVEVSAKQKLNLDRLLQAIALQAEVLELTANPDRPAEGIVIEAKLERGRGPVGTVLVQRGTLKVGQIVVAGRAWGRVRALIDDKGANVVAAGPSTPVEVLGFDSAPDAGDQLAVVETEARARELTEHRQRKLRDVRSVGAGARSSLEQMMKQAAKGGKKDFLLIIKGDVQGSVEAINSALEKLGTDEVEARIIHWGVGGITSSDVALAEASGAVIIAFNVRADAQAKQQAERDGIEIRYYNIIYDLVDDVKKAMSGLLAPITREEFLGNAEILEVFNISKVGKVAGCRVTEGKVERGASVRLVRDHVVIHEGKLSTLKRFKDEVKEVVVGQECGMAFEGNQDLKAGDTIECFRTHIETRSL